MGGNAVVGNGHRFLSVRTLLVLGLLLTTLTTGCFSGSRVRLQENEHPGVLPQPEQGAWFYTPVVSPEAPKAGWRPTLIITGTDAMYHHSTLAWREGENQWRRVAPGGTVPEKPALSPDGQWLAFTVDAGVWVVRSDGTGAGRVDGGLPFSRYQWTLGPRLVIFSDETGAVRVIDAARPAESGTIATGRSRVRVVSDIPAISAVDRGRVTLYSIDPPFKVMSSQETQGADVADWVDRQTLLLMAPGWFAAKATGKTTGVRLDRWNVAAVRASVVAPKSRLIAVEYELPSLGKETPAFVAVLKADTGNLVGFSWGGPHPPNVDDDYYQDSRFLHMDGLERLALPLLAWSPDEQYLAVSNWFGQARFARIGENGLTEKDPAETAGEPVTFLTWVPDGHAALVQTQKSRNLVLYDPELATVRPLAVQPGIKVTSAVWLP